MPYHGILDSSRIKRWVAPTNLSIDGELISDATLTGQGDVLPHSRTNEMVKTAEL